MSKNMWEHYQRLNDMCHDLDIISLQLEDEAIDCEEELDDYMPYGGRETREQISDLAYKASCKLLDAKKVLDTAIYLAHAQILNEERGLMRYANKKDCK